jgi:Papain fold toxin 1, glutamine deamidase
MRLFWSIRLLLLFAIFGLIERPLSVLCSPLAISQRPVILNSVDYDGENHTTFVYDASSMQVLRYDATNTLPANKSTNRLVVGHALLAGFNTFLAAEGEGSLAGSIGNVNPTGGTMNCVNCAIASDATLAGNAASALPGSATSISVLEDTFGGTFQPVSGQMQIGSILSQSGNGARGIVFGESASGDVGHVFNVLNNNGTVQFLDGQIGGSGLNNFNNFQNFQFLLTHPGTP